jgi:hypothetical protein
MRQIISYQRPETGGRLARISVPNEAETPRQIRRLEALGYAVLDVSPISPGPVAVPRAAQRATVR